MNKYIKWGLIIGFVFGFFIVGIVQIAQHNYCPLKPFGNPNKWSDICPLSFDSVTTKCIEGVFMVRSNCLSFLTFWGSPNDILLIPNIVYAFIYSLIGLLFGLMVSLIGYLYSKFKE